MKRFALLSALLLVAAAGLAADPGILALRQLVTLESGLLADHLEDLELQRTALQESLVALRQEHAGFAAAHAQGESLDSLQLRDADLRAAEGQVVMQVFEAQHLRAALLESQSRIAKAEDEIRRLEAGESVAEDPLSGTWNVVIEPGGQDGKFFLRLDGTLIQGTYQLDGGWQGSLRGTLVAGLVRLERIDAQIGYAAIFYGQLQLDGAKPRLQGQWEATQLATGMPSAGAWVAEHE